MSICVAVVGAGRMGTVVAKQLPKRTQKIIIDIDLEKADQLAERVAGISSDSLESAGSADLGRRDLAAVQGWPDWAEPAGFSAPGCLVEGVATLDVAGDLWAISCLLERTRSFERSDSSVLYTPSLLSTSVMAPP